VSFASLDAEALLVALVLAPATYSRNRFFEMYRDPAVRRIRRRANLVRSVLGQLAGGPGAPPGRIVEVRELASGQVEVTFVVEALGLTRTTRLEPVELSLLRYALGRAAARTGEAASATALGASEATEADRARIEAALQKLAPSSGTIGGGDGEPDDWGDVEAPGA
jgi:hypothetical protein